MDRAMLLALIDPDRPQQPIGWCLPLRDRPTGTYLGVIEIDHRALHELATTYGTVDAMTADEVVPRDGEPLPVDAAYYVLAELVIDQGSVDHLRGDTDYEEDIGALLRDRLGEVPRLRATLRWNAAAGWITRFSQLRPSAASTVQAAAVPAADRPIFIIPDPIRSGLAVIGIPDPDGSPISPEALIAYLLAPTMAGEPRWLRRLRAHYPGLEAVPIETLPPVTLVVLRLQLTERTRALLEPWQPAADDHSYEFLTERSAGILPALLLDHSEAHGLELIFPDVL